MDSADPQFIGYVGDPEVHDGIITSISQSGATVLVTIRTQSGGELKIEFQEVVSVKSNRPEGMMLYALAEMKNPEHRHFVFANWEDEDDACLEIVAGGYKVCRY